MSEETAIRMNFGKPMPLFPLPSVVLMPHAVCPLHVFEERYRHMVRDALDGPGQIAMAVYAGDESDPAYDGRPPLRPAVCVGQIIQHHQSPDGQYKIALQGLCRARIVHEMPADEDRMYREAILDPFGISDIDEEALAAPRYRLTQMLEAQPLASLREAEGVVRHLGDENIPTSAILELVTFSILMGDELRYRLLAEGDASRRAIVIEQALGRLEHLLKLAAPQRKAPEQRGVSLN